MATRSLTEAMPGEQGHPCPCGCAPCDADCCRLDCVVQPRFFCGQLLTDRDLTALVGWTQDKLRLARFRDGWGVVCGLDVRADPADPARVFVGPGYAVSCCGDDIVVCEAAGLDLTPACRPKPDPCAEPRPCDGPGAEVSPSPAVDVVIRYAEEDAEPQAALSRGACGQTAACEFSRRREVFTLGWMPATGDPLAARATRWEEGYAGCLDVLTRFRAAFASPASADPATVRDWLVRWIDAHPLHQFRHLRDDVCGMPAGDLTDEAALARLLFWLVQDCRNAYLGCACHACDEDPGVPLARVWLTASASREGGCAVSRIDPYPPYRRPLAGDCWPAALGQVNAGQVVWHRWPEACTRLADLGVRVAGTAAFTIPATLSDLASALDCSPFVACRDAVTVQVFDAGALGTRVVGFCGSSVVAPPRLALTVSKRTHASEVEVGAAISYVVEVHNSGDAALTLDMEDSVVGALSRGALEPGESLTREYEAIAPSEPSAAWANTVSATGTASDGRTVTEQDSAEVRVVPHSGATDLRLIKTCSHAEALPGTAVTYTFQAAVYGDGGPVPVTLVDDVLGQLETDVALDVGVIRTFEHEYVVPPETAPGDLINTAVLRAPRADGGTIQSAANHYLRVLEPGRPEPVRYLELTAIAGIGPGRAGQLERSGIASFRQLAETPIERLREVFPDLGVGTLERWREEAAEAADA